MPNPASTSSYVPDFSEDAYTAEGSGVIVQGKLWTQRFLTLTSKDNIHRYLIFLVEVAAAHTRVFNRYGSEEMIDDLLKDAPTKLSELQLCSVLGAQSGQAIPPTLGVGKDLLSLTHPAMQHSFAFFVDPDMVKNAPFHDGENVMLRTKKNSVFVSKVARSDAFHFEGMENQSLLTQIAQSTNEYVQRQESVLQSTEDSEWY